MRQPLNKLEMIDIAWKNTSFWKKNGKDTGHDNILVVPTKEINSDYNAGKPILIVEGAEGFIALNNVGSTHKHQPATKEYFRPATKTEIKSFFKQLPEWINFYKLEIIFFEQGCL